MAILNLCRVLVLQMVFEKNGVWCQTEYLEGTAMARVWFGVLGGYRRRLGVVMSD
jgi:hypothetical protein